MNKVEMWVSEDGKVFETPEECLTHENKTVCSNEIAFYLEKEFCFAIGYSNPKDIAKYIVNNLDKFNLKFKGN